MATNKNFDGTGSTWVGSDTLTKGTGTTYKIKTATSYVAKDIELTVTPRPATVSVAGGALNNKTATATFTNMEVDSTDTSGVSILAIGRAGRAAVTYNGAVDGWVTATSGNTVTGGSAISASNWNGTTYYAKGVTLTNGKSFYITVPNGNSGTITFNFTVDNNGNVTVD